MSMLKYFFELDGNRKLFKGLAIMEEPELCEKYMGKFPVVFLSLKDIDADTYETAFAMAAMLIKEEAGRHRYLLDSENLTLDEKQEFSKLLKERMDQAVLCGSLKLMSRLLEKHHKQKAVVLIDEYDVPLARANAQGYYDEMVILIRSLFQQVLKTNRSLQCTVLTGCMRISREALGHIEKRQYGDVFYDEDIEKILKYGIACYKNKCRVMILQDGIAAQ